MTVTTTARLDHSPNRRCEIVVCPSSKAITTIAAAKTGELLGVKFLITFTEGGESSRRLARVRRCANDKCRWVFLDDSKSANRRWCSMSACGNRAKAHRHYARRRQG